MRVPGKLLKGLAIGLAALAILILVVRTWVVKAVIVGQIRAAVGGEVEIRDWWLNGRSAGVTGLTVRDGTGARSPVWASAERVTTDLTLGGLLRGRFAPGRITIRGADVALDFNEKGSLSTKVGGDSRAGSRPIPVLIAEGARLSLRQKGRPAMVVSGVTARLGPNEDRVILSARSTDRNWGLPEAHGEVDKAFQAGSVELKTTADLLASPAKVREVPFVPAEVWKNVTFDGPVGIALKAGFDRGAVHVRTEIGLRGTTVRSDALDLTATGATGRVIVDDAVVTFREISGEAIDGRVAVNGEADFRKPTARFDVGLDLDHIDVLKTPKSWQLDEAGVTGYLSGKARLVALVGPSGVDLTGTSGKAVIDQGTLRGIPVKAWTLTMSAEGNDLKYGSADESQKRSQRPDSGRGVGLVPTVPRGNAVFDAPRRPVAVNRGRGASKTAFPRGAWERAPGLLAGLVAVALQAPPEAGGEPKAPEEAPAKPKIQLPRSITTHLELEDVELSQLIAKAQFLLGFPFPVPIAGRLTLNADATIPLGTLTSLKEYAFHGDLVLNKASIYKVDLGRVSARIDLADGVLDLKDLRGHLVDHPDGGPDNPPKAEGVEVPLTGPLPPGAFRGGLRAAFAPPGKLTARFEGDLLPMGELAAPVFPRPTPLSGLVTMNVEAEADLSAATDPAAWVASGTAQSRQIHYQGAALDGVSVRFGLKNGRLDVPELSALLKERPLRAKLGLDLNPPRAFEGVVDVAGWDLAEVLAWVPAAPRPAPVGGTLSARAEATGTLSPVSVKTEGRGSFERFQAGPVTLGAVPFQWTTRGDTVALSVTDAHPFGGRLTAEANVPMSPGKPIDGSATVEALDTAALSATIPGASLKMTGLASGKVTFSVPADVSAMDATIRLSAPDLTVQGVPAEQVRASVRARDGSLGYEVSADSLGGVIRFKGAFPLGAVPVQHQADGELRAVGFTLDKVWKALGLAGVVTDVSGRGAIDTNLRAVLGGPSAGLYAHGYTELRDLKWGRSASLGGLKGVMMMTPAGWRIDPISGDLLGGLASGSLWGSTAGAAGPGGDPAGGRQVGFDVRVDRAELSDAAAMLPVAAGLNVSGFGTVRLAGTLGDVLRATGDLRVPSARVSGVPVTELKVPVVVTTTGGNGSGVVHVRRYSARIAGGSVHGDALVHVGANRAFQGDMVLTDVDLESIALIASDARRPASGKISGRVALNGHDIASTRSYRGTVNLTLDDASLVALPVFRELDRFLGSARGGLFEAGDLSGSVANRELIIDAATLVGRLAQLHVSGTVGFDGQLNLEVLVNMNQLLPQAGAALVAVVPGFRGGRGGQANLEVTNYLSNKLLKLRVTGTLKNPSVNIDPGVAVAGSAVGFFSGVLKIPLGLVK